MFPKYDDLKSWSSDYTHYPPAEMMATIISPFKWNMLRHITTLVGCSSYLNSTYPRGHLDLHFHNSTSPQPENTILIIYD